MNTRPNQINREYVKDEVEKGDGVLVKCDSM